MPDGAAQALVGTQLPAPRTAVAAAASLHPAWWAAWVLFVVYGSLLPFDYQPLPLQQALENFARLPFLRLGVGSRADWVANGVLYLPIGALTAQQLSAVFRGRATPLAIVLAIGFGLALATGVEFTQQFFPPRTVSQNDLIAEAIGTVLGALAAPLLLPWLRHLTSGWRIGGVVLAQRLLVVYALGYLALSLFPYDLLLDAGEWQAKLASDLCSGWLAGPTRDRGWLGLLLLGVEVVLVLPFGLLLALGRPDRTVPLPRAALIGLLLGLAIEGAQLAIASGVSQGASVLCRVVGVVLGAWMGAQGAQSLVRWRELLTRHALALQAVHVALVLAASGWFGHAWRPLSQVPAQWAELRLMPFYYHYFTTEAVALFSLGSVALMYLPVALMGWALRRPAAADLLLAGALALLAETGKLGLEGLHPDPSNVVIAIGACAAARLLIRRAGVRPQAVPPAVVGAVVVEAPRARGLTALAIALAAVGVALALALIFPAAALPLAALVAVASAAVAYRPAWALVLLPAAMPVLDLAPLSGRLLWDEFDLLQLALLAVVWLRTRSADRAPRPPVPVALKLALALLGASLAASLLRGLWPWSWPDANSLASMHDPYNALRIGKGALWAWALVVLMRRLPESDQSCQRRLGIGLCLGLALALAVVLWERAAFVGLADFQADYRVTGPFSAMHTGGATIECFIAVAAAVALAALLQAQRLWARLALLLLLLLASYAMMVTYSRNGYGALLVAVLVVALAAAHQRAAPMQRRLAGGLVALVMLAAAVPVLLGEFAQQRMARTAQDYAVRVAHWHDALALRDPGAVTALFGAGLGRFPDLHFWRSAEPARVGLFRLDADASGPLLRLGAGTAVYVEQLVDVGPGQQLQLTLSQRVAPGARLGIALCEKWMLTSAQCARIEPGPVQTQAGWQRAQWRLDTGAWTGAPRALARPVKLSLFHAGGQGTVDVAQVQLSSDDGRLLLANGDFHQGLDHWFHSTDVDPPWHIHSWPVTVLFEQGWLGVMAWAAVLLLALSGAARRAWRGDLVAAGVLAALLAFTVSGLVNTLTDAPRLLWLWCLLLWLGAAMLKTGPGKMLR